LAAHFPRRFARDALKNGQKPSIKQITKEKVMKETLRPSRAENCWPIMKLHAMSVSPEN
jgi:hypothetical protein